MIADNEFLWALWDSEHRSYYLTPTGGVDAVADFHSVPHPLEWKEAEDSFDTIEKYFSLVAAKSGQYTFPLDGAEILRYLLYKRRGFEETVYVIRLKWNPDTGAHEKDYYGKIDMSKCVDDPLKGVSITASEGGVQAILDSEEGVTQEIKLDETNPDAVPVLFTGIELFDTYNYESYDFTMQGGGIVPLVFINNEGDSVGIKAREGQQPDSNTDNTYWATSANYTFSSVNPVTVRLRGTFFYDNSIGDAIDIILYTSKYIFPNPLTYIATVGSPSSPLPHGIKIGIPFDFTYNAAAGENLFVYTQTTGVIPLNITGNSFLSISFKSKNDPSFAWHIPPYQLGKQLLNKMSGGKYTHESTYFQAHNNLMLTSGEALRNLPAALLKISYEDYYQIYNSQYCMCLTIRNNIPYLERAPVYYSGSGAIVFDLGELSEYKTLIDDSRIVKTILVGYEKIDYDERAGRFEYNTRNEFTTTTINDKRVLDLISKARGDSHGEEFIRGKTNNKDTTDNPGDNSIFQNNVDISTYYKIPSTFDMDWTASTGIMKLYNQASNIALFPVGKFFIINSNQAEFNNALFSVVTSTVNGNNIDLTINEVPAAVLAGFFGTITFPATLTRRATTNLPTETTFNKDEMTPSDRLRFWGSYIRSVDYQIQNDLVSFASSKGNADLIRNGTIAEKANILISSFDAPFFLACRKGSFTVEPPATFYKTLRNLQSASRIIGNYNGFQLNFLPWGKMSVKSATHEAQQWELMLSADNNLDTLNRLSYGGLYTSYGMDNQLYCTIYNPVQWVYANRQLPLGVKYKDIFDDWVHHRNDQFAVQPAYFQKWEQIDRIKAQFVTFGIGQIEMRVYDRRAKLINILQSTIIVNPSVRSPAVLQQFDLPAVNLNGVYVLAIYANDTLLLVSEWQHIAPVHPDTYIVDYYHSTNKIDTYFVDSNTKQVIFNPQIRFEMKWGKPLTDGSAVEYVTERNNLHTLSSEEFVYKGLYVGYYSTAETPTGGIPDYLQIKFNSISKLDRFYVEKAHTVRPANSPLEENPRPGVPFSTFSVNLRNASGNLGLVVLDNGTIPISRKAIYTIDAEAYDADDTGSNTGKILQVEIDEL